MYVPPCSGRARRLQVPGASQRPLCHTRCRQTRGHEDALDREADTWVAQDGGVDRDYVGRSHKGRSVPRSEDLKKLLEIFH